MLVGNGPHHGTHGEAVEVVVNKDQHAQHDGGHLGPHPAFDVLRRPAAEGGGAPRLVHQAHHGPQDDQEHQNAHVVGVGQHGDDAVLKHVEDRPLKVEAGVQQSAHQNSDKQGGVHLFCDQSQSNGHHRGQQGPGGGVKGADKLLRLLPRGKGPGGHGHDHQHQHRQQRQPGSHFSHISFPSI